MFAIGDKKDHANGCMPLLFTVGFLHLKNTHARYLKKIRSGNRHDKSKEPVSANPPSEYVTEMKYPRRRPTHIIQLLNDFEVYIE